MAASVTVKVTGVAELVHALEKITPAKNPAWLHIALKKAALQVANLAKFEFILPGGRFFKPGAKQFAKPVINPKRLTSRSGRLRDSIAVDLSASPKSVDVGTSVLYGAVHELGGRFVHARPFLSPALEKASRDFQALFAREWERQIP